MHCNLLSNEFGVLHVNNGFSLDQGTWLWTCHIPDCSKRSHKLRDPETYQEVLEQNDCSKLKVWISVNCIRLYSYCGSRTLLCMLLRLASQSWVKLQTLNLLRSQVSWLPYTKPEQGEWSIIFNAPVNQLPRVSLKKWPTTSESEAWRITKSWKRWIFLEPREWRQLIQSEALPEWVLLEMPRQATELRAVQQQFIKELICCMRFCKCFQLSMYVSHFSGHGYTIITEWKRHWEIRDSFI